MTREKTGALAAGTDGPLAEAAAAPPPAASADDLATVYGWLSRLPEHPDQTERLLVEVLRRSRGVAPTCVAGASDPVRLQFLTIHSVLRRRGVI